MKAAGLLLLLLLTNTASAKQFFCPSNYKYINTGDTMAAVRDACGAPTTERQERRRGSNLEDIEQWIYRPRGSVTSTVSIPNVTVNFKNNEVDSIVVEGQQVVSSTACHGNTVSKGDSKGRVSSACGNPSFINQGKQEIPGGRETVTIWEYDFSNYQSKLQLIFKEGILESISGGN